jgi:hypothetical protein
MQEEVKQDVLAVLAKAKTAVQDKDEVALVRISNETIHDASIYQDDYSTDIAVAMYALSKIMVRDSIVDFGVYVKLIDEAYESLSNDKIEEYHNVIHKLLRDIKKMDKSMSNYIQHVLSQAKLKKSAKMYDHGISIAQSASRLGVSQWQLYSYVGKTKMNDKDGSGIGNMKKRLTFARTLFKK